MITEEIQDKILHWRRFCTVLSKNNVETIIFIELEDEENLTLPYEIVTPENIVNKIVDGKMNLDYCYLNNFKYCDITEHLKDIKEISAVGTFF